jgi:hypothetical protein
MARFCVKVLQSVYRSYVFEVDACCRDSARDAALDAAKVFDFSLGKYEGAATEVEYPSLDIVKCKGQTEEA